MAPTCDAYRRLGYNDDVRTVDAPVLLKVRQHGDTLKSLAQSHLKNGVHREKEKGKKKKQEIKTKTGQNAGCRAYKEGTITPYWRNRIVQ